MIWVNKIRLLTRNSYTIAKRIDMDCSNLRALVVDDSSTIRRLLKPILRRLGFEQVDEAEDGAVALELITQNDFDIIFLDWNMPKISGIEVLEIVRSEERTKQIPVIMVTAEAEQTLIIAAIEAGVTNYIVKPFSENTICKKVEGVLNRRCG